MLIESCVERRPAALAEVCAGAPELNEPMRQSFQQSGASLATDAPALARSGLFHDCKKPALSRPKERRPRFAGGALMLEMNSEQERALLREERATRCRTKDITALQLNTDEVTV
jgi:hypothetical protein